MPRPILRVEGLRTYFRVRDGVLKAVDDISFAVEPGKVLCIVGESGSGKSVTALSILRLIDPPGKIENGRIFYRDNDLLRLPEAEITRNILLIADEPTTALDVTIQAQILRLLANLQKRLNSAMILITHDLGVVAAMADEVMVMYAGRVVEHADVETLFRDPRHPYTVGLLDSVLELDEPRETALRSIPGVPPVPVNMPAGCSFRPRCPRAIDVCAQVYPALRGARTDHEVACHLQDNAPRDGP